MGRGKNLDSLRKLDCMVLGEVVREGELRMAAQLTAATAADQRALTWAGFVLTIAIASIGASATLAMGDKHMPLAVITGLGGILMALSGYSAIKSVRPKHYAMPGNCPENWLPESWEDGRETNMLQARIEQARCLNNQIADNINAAKADALMLQRSMDLAAITVLLASLYSGGYVVWALLV